MEIMEIVYYCAKVNCTETILIYLLDMCLILEGTFQGDCRMKLVHHAASAHKGWNSVWKTHAVRPSIIIMCAQNHY